MAQTLDLDITGMTCDHCVKAITSAVKEVPGVREANVSLAANAAHVEGDSLDPAKIIAAIEEEGYGATVR